MTEIVLEQRIAAPPSTVYRYLTESDRWKLWQGADAKLDPRPGGIFSMIMGNGMNARGQFVELVPHERVVFTWGWIDQPGIPPGSTTVEVVLSATDDGTLLVLTHRSIPDEESAMQQMGWLHYLPRLAIVAAGGSPEPDTGPG
ncbi:MAG: SRPBCC domain-containing protein [Actinomycetia bacterium]|nr:SRPBCC domain-containing protein [Actinomycetes bacterium]